jgi:hypothetical protein
MRFQGIQVETSALNGVSNGIHAGGTGLLG